MAVEGAVALSGSPLVRDYSIASTLHEIRRRDQRIPLSYGIPSAFGAREFLDVNASTISEMI